MKRIKTNKSHLWNFYVFPLVFFTTVSCYPALKPDLETQPEIRDEKTFPNGTVVGRYTYTDNEGNPIQVKYYADDASYGVELKSIKVVDATGEPLPSMTVMNYQKEPQVKFDYLAKSAEFEEKAQTDNSINLGNTNNSPVLPPANKYKSDPYDFLNKEVSKVATRYKVEKPNSDYEIFYPHELKGPKKWNKDKIRVYFDKANRQIRSPISSFNSDQICEQF